MSDEHAADGDLSTPRLREPPVDPAVDKSPHRRGALATVWSTVTAVVGGIMGLLPICCTT
jgi:hypothetical protein